MNAKAKVIPLNNDEQAVWLPPEKARHYFWNQKKNIQGISLGTMMNRIYSCELNGRVRFDEYRGWQVRIPIEVFENKAA